MIDAFVVAALLLSGPQIPTADSSAKKICRYETSISSRLAQRRCHTAEQWRVIDAASKSSTDESVREMARGNRTFAAGQ